MHNFKRKNEKRHIVDKLLTLVIAAALGMLCFLGIYQYGVFSKSLMSEAVNSSDYYERQYQRFEQELKLFLGAIAVPTSVVEEDQSLQEWYFFELRKKVLVEDRKGAFEESVRDKIEGPIRQYLTEHGIKLSSEAELGFDNIILSLEDNLNMEINHPDIVRWYEGRDAFIRKSMPVIVSMIITVLFSLFLLFIIQHYIYRAFFYAGMGFLLGGILGGFAAGIFYFSLEGNYRGRFLSVEMFLKSAMTQGLLIPIMLFFVGISFLIVEHLMGHDDRK